MFRIGAEVFTSDEERAGRLASVVIDPHSKEVTDFVIDRGLIGGEDRVLPVSKVDRADEERIELTIAEADLSDYSRYREESFEQAQPALVDELGYEPTEVFTWEWRYGIPVAPLKPRLQEHPQVESESKRAAIGRGTRVRNANETIGYVDHVLVDQESEQISHLIVRRGLLPYRISLPFDMVEEVTDESVYVPATRAELESLQRYMPRADLAIKAEAQTRLAELETVTVDYVEVDVVDGMIALGGYVADVEARRAVHHRVSAIEGVVGVRDQLYVDQDLRAAALTALLLDSRTELERIDVTVEAGVATLEGAVSHRRLTSVAEQVVAQQAGVRSVNNMLNA